MTLSSFRSSWWVRPPSPTWPARSTSAVVRSRGSWAALPSRFPRRTTTPIPPTAPVKVPQLIVHGLRDDDVPFEVAPYIAAAGDGIDTLIFEDEGHYDVIDPAAPSGSDARVSRRHRAARTSSGRRECPVSSLADVITHQHIVDFATTASSVFDRSSTRLDRDAHGRPRAQRRRSVASRSSVEHRRARPGHVLRLPGLAGDSGIPGLRRELADGRLSVG